MSKKDFVSIKKEIGRESWKESRLRVIQSKEDTERPVRKRVQEREWE